MLIGGFRSKAHQWLPLQHTLAQHGMLPVAWTYYAKATTFEEQVEDLAEALERHKSHVGTCKVHFVAHSYGALVLRGALRAVNWGGHALSPAGALSPCAQADGSRVVLIAPMNQGCALARQLGQGLLGKAFLGSACGQQLARHGPEWWAAAAGDLPASLSTVHVIRGEGGWNPLMRPPSPAQGREGGAASPGRHDGVLWPWETGLTTPHTHTAHAWSHTALLYSPAVRQEVARVLTQQAAPMPPPASSVDASPGGT